jgi:hypothetical protein
MAFTITPMNKLRSRYDVSMTKTYHWMAFRISWIQQLNGTTGVSITSKMAQLVWSR